MQRTCKQRGETESREAPLKDIEREGGRRGGREQTQRGVMCAERREQAAVMSDECRGRSAEGGEK